MAAQKKATKATKATKAKKAKKASTGAHSASSDDHVADARPTKRFFISMLTRDIELLPAILDLVDNSLDGARALTSGGSYEGLHVHLTVTSESFAIEDNCGGIDPTTARDYAFRFGRPSDFEGIPSSVGQFGVGMKRALFKIGNEFAVSSTSESGHFEVEVDVVQWSKDEQNGDWTFPLTVEPGSHQRSDTGTKITVRKLHEATAEDLARPEVEAALVRQVAVRHESALSNGMTITVNGTPAEAAAPRLVSSADLSPVNNYFDISEGGGTVSVQIVAGIAPPLSEDGTRDEGQAEDFSSRTEAGWYVYCNDRLVLFADRSELTGWGSAAGAYHPQYRRFRGFVFLSAADSSLLPWNTTKTGLDQDSKVFRRVQSEMFKTLREVQAVINRHKKEASYDDEQDTPLVEAFRSNEARPLRELEERSQFKAPSDTARNPTPPSTLTVQYRVEKVLLQRVMDHLGEQSGAKVGRYTFDYFVDSELPGA